MKVRMRYKPASNSMESFYTSLARTPDSCTDLDLSDLGRWASVRWFQDDDCLKNTAIALGKISVSLDVLNLSENRLTPQQLAVFFAELSVHTPYNVLDLRNNDFSTLDERAHDVTTLTSKVDYRDSLIKHTVWHAKTVIFSAAELIRMSKPQLSNFAKLFPWYAKLIFLNEEEKTVISENIKYFRKKVMSGFLFHSRNYDTSLRQLMRQKNLPEDVVSIIASYLSIGGGRNSHNQYLKYSRTFFSFNKAMVGSNLVNPIKPEHEYDIRRLELNRGLALYVYLVASVYVFWRSNLLRKAPQEQKGEWSILDLLCCVIVILYTQKKHLIRSAQSGYLSDLLALSPLSFEVLRYHANVDFDNYELAIRNKRLDESVADTVDWDDEDAAFEDQPRLAYLT